ncbi:hypothetical protein DFH07DRAFT_1063825 [Mycena maculata]|uniref:Uncharacterized protein n=1 Tax=Mycena maculata TaxID=230809 RepID=A0AAD7IFY2_9AGAR|nr:hypothetical protein DFH07DRAFT_1063825 [Mycena maculata]
MSSDPGNFVFEYEEAANFKYSTKRAPEWMYPRVRMYCLKHLLPPLMPPRDFALLAEQSIHPYTGINGMAGRDFRLKFLHYASEYG